MSVMIKTKSILIAILLVTSAVFGEINIMLLKGYSAIDSSSSRNYEQVYDDLFDSIDSIPGISAYMWDDNYYRNKISNKTLLNKKCHTAECIKDLFFDMNFDYAIIATIKSNEHSIDVLAKIFDTKRGSLVTSTLRNYNFHRETSVKTVYSLAHELIYCIKNTPEINGINNNLAKNINCTDSAYIQVRDLIDSRDNRKYQSIKIGSQELFSENLKFNSPNSWCYENSIQNCEIYGRLYKYIDAKTACPDGWHLPTDDEWDELSKKAANLTASNEMIDDDYETLGKILKSKEGWTNHGNGTDLFGFNALPGGYRTSNGLFENKGKFAGWWSSTGASDSLSFYRTIRFSYDRFYRVEWDKNSAISVRCFKNIQR